MTVAQVPGSHSVAHRTCCYVDVPTDKHPTSTTHASDVPPRGRPALPSVMLGYHRHPFSVPLDYFSRPVGKLCAFGIARSHLTARCALESIPEARPGPARYQSSPLQSALPPRRHLHCGSHGPMTTDKRPPIHSPIHPALGRTTSRAARLET